MTELLHGWKRVLIGDIAHVKRGASPRPIRDPRWFGGDVGWVRIADVTSSHVYLRKTTDYLSPLGVAKSVRVYPGEVILSIAATVGEVAIIDMAACIHDGFVALKNLASDVDTRYLYYVLLFNQPTFKKAGQHGSQANINSTIVEDTALYLPPLPEQRKIAEILSTWDEAIALTEQLIDALERRKKGLMQRLLTGAVRFPEYVRSNDVIETKYGDIPADWGYVPIGEVAREVSRKNDGGCDLTVLSCTKYDGLVDSLEYFGRQIFSDDTSTYKLVARGQFAYATNHIEEGSIGYQDLYDCALISPMYTVFETERGLIDDRYLFKLLKTELYRHIFEVSTSGTVNRRGSLRWNDFSRIHIPLPPLHEQQAIAEVLETSDQEIKLVQRQRDALQQQKKGLMQRLLTGQVRVKV